MKIENLEAFYSLMMKTRDVRLPVVEAYLESKETSTQAIDFLIDALNSLESIPKEKDQYCLKLDKSKNILLDLSYEINELKKDIFFLEHTEDEFFAYLEKLHPDFSNQVNTVVNALKDVNFRTLITDRDGTVNNYCGRYASSIQSIYNAVFLTRFALNRLENAIILTSAPLDNIGLADISVSPENAFIFAGSKAREYFNKAGERCQFPVEESKQKKLDELNKELTELVNQPKYHMFTLIGSGLQYKFGQTTIARQDITKTIPESESNDFMNLVKNIVSKIDPENKFFRIEDTGKDIEIILTIEGDSADSEAKDFDKGDGVNFMNDDLDLNIHQGANLICGDTNSDVPMIPASMEKTKDTYAIFVTKDENLKEKVHTACQNSFIVSEPDMLVAILNILGKK